MVEKVYIQLVYSGNFQTRSSGKRYNGRNENMLELYSMDSCPYCRKVKDYLISHNIPYIEHDVNNPESAMELMKLGGKPQVPFLVDKDNNVYIYDSEHIIQYIKDKE